MKIKNIAVCGILILNLCLSAYAVPFSLSLQEDSVKQDVNELKTLLSDKVAPFYSESGLSPAMQLIQAIQRRDTETIEIILESIDKFNVNEQDEFGYTALMWAIGKYGMESVSRNLAYHSDLTVKDRKGRNALMWAINKNRSETINAIIDNLIWREQYDEFNAQDEEGNTAMMYAARKHDNKVIERLFNITDTEGNYVVILNPLKLKEYPKNGSYAVNETLCLRNNEILQMFIDGKDKDGNYRIDLNYIDNSGYTLLSRASKCSLADVTILLNAKDDDGNYRVTNINSSRFTENPLMQAIVAGDIEILRYLLEASDDEGNFRISLETKLSKSASCSLPDGSRIMLNEGDSILNIAMKSKQDNIIAYLILIGTLRK